MSTPPITTLDQAVDHARDVLKVIGGDVPPAAEVLAALDVPDAQALAQLRRALRAWEPLISALEEARAQPFDAAAIVRQIEAPLPPEAQTYVPRLWSTVLKQAEAAREEARAALLEAHGMLERHRTAPAGDLDDWHTRRLQLVDVVETVQRVLAQSQVSLEHTVEVVRIVFARAGVQV